MESAGKGSPPNRPDDPLLRGQHLGGNTFSGKFPNRRPPRSVAWFEVVELAGFEPRVVTVAVNSFVLYQNCAGAGFGYRVDVAGAHDFVQANTVW